MDHGRVGQARRSYFSLELDGGSYRVEVPCTLVCSVWCGGSVVSADFDLI